MNNTAIYICYGSTQFIIFRPPLDGSWRAHSDSDALPSQAGPPRPALRTARRRGGTFAIA
ncbi:hypothetical protein PanWU01x14_091180 [Parasponia andersonii]|uniref:Uncharacterized protein n=1 Tax=Parasponia andersonii TaxID=3476 RepID=A0A2P5D708_PARAD|nr:hypothetical protein PanWU01x14_091180 [Parasponia andersonii]